MIDLASYHNTTFTVDKVEALAVCVHNEEALAVQVERPAGVGMAPFQGGKEVLLVHLQLCKAPVGVDMTLQGSLAVVVDMALVVGKCRQEVAAQQ